MSPAAPSAAAAVAVNLDPRRSLIARLGWVFGGGYLLLAIVTVWASEHLLRQRLYAMLGDAFENLATQLSDRIDHTLQHRLHELSFTANLPAFQAGGTDAERRAVLEALQEQSPDFAWIGFLAADGRVRCATAGVLEGGGTEPLSHTVATEPHVGRFQPHPEISAATLGGLGEAPRLLDLAVAVTPARDTAQSNDASKTGALQESSAGNSWPSVARGGIIGGYLRADWLAELDRLALPATARADGLGVTVYADDGDVLYDSARSGWTRPPALPDLKAQPASGTMAERTREGDRFVTGYRRSRGFRDYAGRGWVVVVRQPAALAFAPVQQLRSALVLWFALSVAVFGVVVAAILARLYRQLHAIAIAAERIRGGDALTEMPRLTGDSELAAMSGAVADVVQALRAPPPAAAPGPAERAKDGEASAGQPKRAAGERPPRPILW